jgi:hypothetical protein
MLFMQKLKSYTTVTNFYISTAICCGYKCLTHTTSKIMAVGEENLKARKITEGTQIFKENNWRKPF